METADGRVQEKGRELGAAPCGQERKKQQPAIAWGHAASRNCWPADVGQCGASKGKRPSGGARDMRKGRKNGQQALGPCGKALLAERRANRPGPAVRLQYVKST